MLLAGCGTSVSSSASALQRQRAAQVTLLALGVPRPRHARAAVAAGVELVSVPLKLEWMQGSDDDVAQTRQTVAQIARATRADILHANQFAAACAPVDIPIVLTLHSDVLSWSRATHGTVPRDRWPAYVALVADALRRADVITAVSAFLAAEVCDLYAVDRPIQVIHNGWPAASEPLQPPEPPVTLLAGRAWDMAKNVELAMRGAQGWSPGPVYLAGETHHPESGTPAAIQPPLRALGHLDADLLGDWLERGIDLPVARALRSVRALATPGRAPRLRLALE